MNWCGGRVLVPALDGLIAGGFSWRTELAGDHWLWLGEVDRDGHGVCRVDGRKLRVHRVVYEALVEPIPAGQVLDHVCRVRQCCNPEHLEPVTHVENVRRGGPASRTHCPQGHPYDKANTLIRIRAGRRIRRCRDCRNAQRRRRREALRRAEGRRRYERRKKTGELGPLPARPEKGLSTFLDQPPTPGPEGPSVGGALN